MKDRVSHSTDQKLGLPGGVGERLVCPQKTDVILIQGRHEVLMVDDLVHIPNKWSVINRFNRLDNSCLI